MYRAFKSHQRWGRSCKIIKDHITTNDLDLCQEKDQLLKHDLDQDQDQNLHNEFAIFSLGAMVMLVIMVKLDMWMWFNTILRLNTFVRLLIMVK